MCKVTTFFADSAPYETETDSQKMFFARATASKNEED